MVTNTTFPLILLFSTLLVVVSGTATVDIITATGINSNTIRNIVYGERRLLLFNSRHLTGECRKFLARLSHVSDHK